MQSEDTRSLLLRGAADGNLTEVKISFEKAKMADAYFALLVAAANGHLHVVEWLQPRATPAMSKNCTFILGFLLLSSGGSNLLVPKWRALTPLMLAALRGHLCVVQWLIAVQGDSIAQADSHGRTALLFAAAGGHLALVQWLLAVGANIAQADCHGRTALLFAAAGGHLAVVQWLLNVGGATIAEADSSGCTALLLAASRGHSPVVQWLLSNGAHIGETDSRGTGVLLHSAARGNLELVQLLLTKYPSLLRVNYNF